CDGPRAPRGRRVHGVVSRRSLLYLALAALSTGLLAVNARMMGQIQVANGWGWDGAEYANLLENAGHRLQFLAGARVSPPATLGGLNHLMRPAVIALNT